jgi:4-amino-4-deoxy-L-arabinose transferase-like glycosyltransferase
LLFNHRKPRFTDGQTRLEVEGCKQSTRAARRGETPLLRYILRVRQLVRQHLRFFLIACLAGLGLRLLFLFRFPGVTTDSFVYGDIAKNWLQHGIYGLSGPDEISATYIRLPGYPAFLAAVFAVFGMEHYRAALVLQIFVDLGTCLVIADMGRRLISPKAAKAAFLLAALCPFLASYSAAALTETLEIFFTALALDFAIAGLMSSEGMWPWLGCGVAIAGAILLRPDGGLLLMAIGLYLLILLGRKRIWIARVWVRTSKMRAAGAPAPHGLSVSYILRVGLILVLVSLAPLVPWGLRNLHTLHRFQPLAPRYANEEDEFVPAGFNRWVKTWTADYASVEEIYWPVPGETVDTEKLPTRAFDSAAQREQTVNLLTDYNNVLHVTPDLDKQFAALASERIRAAPLRYYVWLPFVRIADMWLRPRTETLPSDTRWWEFNDDPKWSALAVALGAIGLVYMVLAAMGLAKGLNLVYVGLPLTFLILRSVFLGTLENPEPRYTLECYPVVILLASIVFR